MDTWDFITPFYLLHMCMLEIFQNKKMAYYIKLTNFAKVCKISHDLSVSPIIKTIARIKIASFPPSCLMNTHDVEKTDYLVT